MKKRCPNCGRFAKWVVGLNGDDYCEACFNREMRKIGKAIRGIAAVVGRVNKDADVGIRVELVDL